MVVHAILITFVVLAGCRDVTDFDEDEFATALRGDPSDTTRSLESLSSDDVKRMEPEWPMVAALVGQRSGEIDISINILDDAANDGKEEYYSLYAEYLVEFLLDRNRLAEAGKVSGELMRRNPSAKSLFLVLRSYYRSRNDAELLDLYNAHQSLIGELDRTERNEVRLMRAVSMLE